MGNVAGVEGTQERVYADGQGGVEGTQQCRAVRGSESDADDNVAGVGHAAERVVRCAVQKVTPMGNVAGVEGTQQRV